MTSHTFKDETGNTFGRLTVLKRLPNDKHGKAVWLCLCVCGSEIPVLGLHLRRGSIKSCKCWRDEWAKTAHSKPFVNYFSAHERIRVARGSASEHLCVGEGCEKPAEDWSYDGGDPDEKIGNVRDEYWLSYSLNPSYYSPRCRKCHKALDNSQRKVLTK